MANDRSLFRVLIFGGAILRPPLLGATLLRRLTFVSLAGNALRRREVKHRAAVLFKLLPPQHLGEHVGGVKLAGDVGDDHGLGAARCMRGGGSCLAMGEKALGSILACVGSNNTADRVNNKSSKL